MAAQNTAQTLCSNGTRPIAFKEKFLFGAWSMSLIVCNFFGNREDSSHSGANNI